jgi:adenine-specific DNA-methyltransferase
MNKEALSYLKKYSIDPKKVNQLIVSNFLVCNSIKVINNKFLRSYSITSDNNDFEQVEGFLKIHQILSFEDLIEAFEFVISPQEKVITGAVYTPEKIRSFIIDEVFKNFNNLEELKVCDPACGCAGFLFSIAKKIKSLTQSTYLQIFEENIYGLDIQEYSVERSKLLLSLLAIYEGEDEVRFNFNIFQGNALNFDWFQNINEFEGFDGILGNPPYVCSRNINDDSKELLKNWSVCKTGHPDLYMPFFELGMANLKEGGILGYITVNSFFKSLNGRALREYFSDNGFRLRILDFGNFQVFNSKSTYTCICTIQKSRSENIEYLKAKDLNVLQSKKIYQKIEYTILDNFNGWNLQEYAILNKIETSGASLGEKFRTRNGIATLKNNIYIFSPLDIEDDKYYFLQNGKTFQIEKEVCVDIINPNKFTKIDSVDSIRQKVIFPYYYEGENVRLIDERSFETKYPLAYSYLKEKKPLLDKRDKGKGNYENWFAFGRNQSLEKYDEKLFFPHIANSTPNFVLSKQSDLLFYNGLAIVGKSEEELLLMKKIMSSRLFWYYITKSSKPYGSGYYSLSRNYIKKFGIYPFDEKEKAFLLKEKNQKKIDKFLEEVYDVNI